MNRKKIFNTALLFWVLFTSPKIFRYIKSKYYKYKREIYLTKKYNRGFGKFEILKTKIKKSLPLFYLLPFFYGKEWESVKEEIKKILKSIKSIIMVGFSNFQNLINKNKQK